MPDRFLYATPAALGLEAEAVDFWSAGGAKLRGWFLRGTKRGTVVFCAGNAGNVSSHLEYVRVILRAGYSVLCFDYRGFGRSEGEADLRSVVLDTEAACEFAAFHSGEPYALFGISLGAGAALAAAGRAASDAVAVAVEGLSDIHGMLEGLFTRGAFGPVKIRAVGGLNGSLAERSRGLLVKARVPRSVARLFARIGAAFYPFEGKSPVSLAKRLGTKPVLLVHGVDDQLLPFEAAIEFHEEMRGPKRLWLIPGVGHAQEPAMARGLEYSAQLEDFFDCAFAGRHPGTPAVRVSDLHAHHPARGCVTARLGLDSSAAGQSPLGPALLTAAGGGVLRQVVLDGPEEVVLQFPGPIESLFTLRILRREPDAGSERYLRGGYQPVFRDMVRTANARDLEGLDAALERHMALERGYPVDFFAALYCIREVEVALGVVPGWRANDPVIARRSLERFIVLWASNPALPGEGVPASPAAWVRAQLVKTEAR